MFCYHRLRCFVYFYGCNTMCPLSSFRFKFCTTQIILITYLFQIQWFWRALRSFDQADRAKFLQFVTGTSKVPLQGFAALEGMNGPQKFQIHRDDRSTDRLPSAHTWYVEHRSHIFKQCGCRILSRFSLN